MMLHKNISNNTVAEKKVKNPQSGYTAFPVKEAVLLLDFLMKAMPGISRTKVKHMLEGGSVKVDNMKTSQFNFPLKPGNTVYVSKVKRSAELRSKYIRLVYEDRHLVVIEKNEGILSVPATAKQFSVKQVLDEYFQRRHYKCTAHVVHRLDRETSGLMMYAKSVEVQQILEAHWHEIVTDRRYVAVLSGVMEKDGGTVASWLKDNKAFVTYSSATDNGGRYAVTHYRTLKRGGHYSLVEMKLETGRKNQIRVHMKDLSHPVAGDRKYGDGTDPIGRLALHAYRLHFYHPVTGEPMRFETPLPPQFVKLFDEPGDAPIQ